MKAIKMICAALAFAAAAAAAGAQNMYDAINFSRNEYLGTARSMALGNAVTAVGGDLGTVGINPAGSAVANYGQMVITPGISISVVGSSYSPSGEMNYGPQSRYSNTRMALPNFGATAVFSTGRSRGLKSFTVGVISNQTAQYNYYADAFGQNSQTSKVAEFAAAAWGSDEGLLASSSAFDASGLSWDIITAYQAGMFGSYGNGADYVGVTEMISGDGTWHYVPGTLAQSSVTQKWGSKNDIILNYGMNFSDKVFVGINVGFPYARYGYSETFFEAAMEPERFPIIYNLDDGSQDETNFLSASYGYQYLADVDGIYGKFGIIVTPFKGLRLGAAIQTPTMYTITEHWQYSAATEFALSSAGYNYNQSAMSPEGEYSYNLIAPYSANFGVAWTFGSRGFVSVDYELTDYSIMRFRELNPRGALHEDIFEPQNETNRYFAGVAHNLRIGAEFRVTPAFSVRAGYGLATTPERYWTNTAGETVTADGFYNDYDSYRRGVKNLVSGRYYKDKTQSVSFGIGYSSPGSFFADLGAMLTSYPDSLFSPYYDYDNYDANGVLVNAASPKILNHRNLWNVALTIGWRF